MPEVRRLFWQVGEAPDEGVHEHAGDQEPVEEPARDPQQRPRTPVITLLASPPQAQQARR